MEEKNQEAQNPQNVENQPIMRYEISEDVVSILRKYFGTKSFVEVADVIPLLKKKILAEDEINLIINRLGLYPYDEVESIFNLLPKNIKQFTAAETANASEEPEVKE